MIELYAILKNQDLIECYGRTKNDRKMNKNLVKHIELKIRNNISRLIQRIKIERYNVYYFKQD